MNRKTDPMKETQTDLTEAAPERFTIDSESAAAWYLRKLAGIDAEIEAIKAATLQRVEELQADRAGLERRFGGELEAWARGEAEKRRRRTVTVPLAGMAVSASAPLRRVWSWSHMTAADIALTLGFVTPPGEPVADLESLPEHTRRRSSARPASCSQASGERKSARA